MTVLAWPATSVRSGSTPVGLTARAANSAAVLSPCWLAVSFLLLGAAGEADVGLAVDAQDPISSRDVLGFDNPCWCYAVDMKKGQVGTVCLQCMYFMLTSVIVTR